MFDFRNINRLFPEMYNQPTQNEGLSLCCRRLSVEIWDKVLLTFYKKTVSTRISLKNWMWYMTQKTSHKFHEKDENLHALNWKESICFFFTCLMHYQCDKSIQKVPHLPSSQNFYSAATSVDILSKPFCVRKSQFSCQ